MKHCGKSVIQFNKHKGQSGQATIEYVLMLVISVGLVLMLMMQLFTPMQKFLDNYMGLYVQCLLEYGELPSFGGESVVTEDSECNAKFESFSGGNGRPPKNGSGSGSDSEKADGSKDGSGSSDGSAVGSSGGGSGGGGGGGGSSYAGSASRGGGRVIRTSRGTRGMDSGGDGKTVEIALDGGGGGGYFTSNNGNRIVVVKKSRAIAMDRIPESVKKKLEKDKNGGKSAIIAVDSGVGESKPKAFALKPPEKKVQIEEDKTEFSIGNTLRIIFIVCIVLVIVIFVGGQFLQMSKSGD